MISENFKITEIVSLQSTEEMPWSSYPWNEWYLYESPYWLKDSYAFEILRAYEIDLLETYRTFNYISQVFFDQKRPHPSMKLEMNSII